MGPVPQCFNVIIRDKSGIIVGPVPQCYNIFALFFLSMKRIKF